MNPPKTDHSASKVIIFSLLKPYLTELRPFQNLKKIPYRFFSNIERKTEEEKMAEDDPHVQI